jgi:hypothetical protein
MQPYSSGESPNPSSPVRSLHPALTTALASLDIQLEEELARYRRLRSGTGQTARAGKRKLAAKPPDLISVPAIGGRTYPVESDSPSSGISAGNGSETQLASLLEGSDAPAGQAAAFPSTPSPSPVLAVEPNNSELAIAVPPPESQLTPDGEAGTADLSSATGGEGRSTLVSTANYQRLDDYLESSEELLRSLAEEEAEVQAERGFMRSLLTPLGVGSMLLLLISSAMFGYVLMNPSSLARLFAPHGSKASVNPADPATNSSQTALVPPQPNLANQEFKDLNLGTLGTLKNDGSARSKGTATSSASAVPSKPTVTSTRLGVSGSSAAAIAPNNSAATSTAPPLPSAASAPALPAQPAPPIRVVDPPEPARISLPSSSRSPASSAYNPAPFRKPPSNLSGRSIPPVNSGSTTGGGNSGSAASASSYGYKVVTQYDSDRTLETVKKVVPDAYVKNFSDGARIQLGASTTAAEAEAKAQALRDQGIPAKVYKP